MDQTGETPRPPVRYHEYENISQRPVDHSAAGRKDRIGCRVAGCLVIPLLLITVGILVVPELLHDADRDSFGGTGATILPFTPRELALLATASDFAALREGKIVHPEDETRYNTSYPDGSFHIGLMYARVDTEAEHIDLDDSVWIESSPEAARTLMEDLIHGESIAGGSLAPFDGYDPVRTEDLFSWGEESRCYTLHFQDLAWGHVFIGREGRKIHHLHVEGVVLDAEEFEAFLRPRLERLREYEP